MAHRIKTADRVKLSKSICNVIHQFLNIGYGITKCNIEGLITLEIEGEENELTLKLRDEQHALSAIPSNNASRDSVKYESLRYAHPTVQTHSNSKWQTWEMQPKVQLCDVLQKCTHLHDLQWSSKSVEHKSNLMERTENLREMKQCRTVNREDCHRKNLANGRERPNLIRRAAISAATRNRAIANNHTDSNQPSHKETRSTSHGKKNAGSAKERMEQLACMPTDKREALIKASSHSKKTAKVKCKPWDRIRSSKSKSVDSFAPHLQSTLASSEDSGLDHLQSKSSLGEGLQIMLSNKSIIDHVSIKLEPLSCAVEEICQSTNVNPETLSEDAKHQSSNVVTSEGKIADSDSPFDDDLNNSYAANSNLVSSVPVSLDHINPCIGSTSSIIPCKSVSTAPVADQSGTNLNFTKEVEVIRRNLAEEENTMDKALGQPGGCQGSNLSLLASSVEVSL